MLRLFLLTVLGLSVGLSLGACGLHVLALRRTGDWRGNGPHIVVKLGWAITMAPLIRALAVTQHVEGTWLAYVFAAGITLTSAGFLGIALDANRTVRLLAVSSSRRVGIEKVEQTLAEVERNGDG